MASDLRHAPRALLRDFEATFVDTGNVITLLGSGVLALGIEQIDDFERSEDRYFVERSIYNDTVYEALDVYGGGGLLLGGTLSWYLIAAANGNEGGVAASQTTLSALTVTGLSTVALKALIRDERPDGNPYGIPSGHASMSMAFATSMDEQYGHLVGLPLGVLSILVGIQRLDRRRHDIDDLVIGWALGWVVGRSVAHAHRESHVESSVAPFVDPATGTWGLTFGWSF